jgi:transcriptional regulator with XRE-family HTH domain
MLSHDEPLQLGPGIRAWRRALRISQAVLAERSGTSRSLISKYERGLVSPTVRQLGRLAVGINVSVCELVSGPPPVHWQPLCETGADLALPCRHRLLPYVDPWYGEAPDQATAEPRWPVSDAVNLGRDCLVTRIHDDSMYPYVQIGDAVLVNPRTTSPQSGSLVLVNGSRCSLQVRCFRQRQHRPELVALKSQLSTAAPTGELRIVGSIVAIVERRLSQ